MLSVIFEASDRPVFTTSDASVTKDARINAPFTVFKGLQDFDDCASSVRRNRNSHRDLEGRVVLLVEYVQEPFSGMKGG